MDPVSKFISMGKSPSASRSLRLLRGLLSVLFDAIKGSLNSWSKARPAVAHGAAGDPGNRTFRFRPLAAEVAPLTISVLIGSSSS
jgi:hypothetical protein